MRKAASLISFSSLALVAMTMYSLAVGAPSVEATNCSISSMYGTVSGTTGTVTNPTDCDYEATFASYNMVMPKDTNGAQWISTQTLLHAVTVNVPAKSTVTVQANTSGATGCGVQNDLIRGGRNAVLEPPFYGGTGLLMGHSYTSYTCGQATPTPTPTATPTVTPTATPTASPTVQPTPQSTLPPAPGGDGKSDGRSDSLGCQKAEDNCNVQPQVLSAQTLPETGGWNDVNIAVISVAVMFGLLGMNLLSLSKMWENEIA